MKSKIYDCFIFNDELDLLKLRLRFLDESVDYFVICESARTLSGMPKKLHYEENKALFEDFSHKIIHLVAPSNNLQAWEYEHFQRNYIKNGLKGCDTEDIIFISDVDEIINVEVVLKNQNLKFPSLIEIQMYYYFLNLKANYTWMLNMVSKYDFLQKHDIGDRLKYLHLCNGNILEQKQDENGWHFSYLLAWDIPRYLSKIKSFSHQEYNNDYFLDPKRIYDRIYWGIDLFDRKESIYSFVSLNNNKLKESVVLCNLESNITKRKLMDYCSLRGIEILIEWELKPRINRWVYLIKYYYKRIPEKLLKK